MKARHSRLIASNAPFMRWNCILGHGLESDGDCCDHSMQMDGIKRSRSARRSRRGGLPKGISVNGIALGPIWTPLQVAEPRWKSWKVRSPTVFERPGGGTSIQVQLAEADASFATGRSWKRRHTQAGHNALAQTVLARRLAKVVGPTASLPACQSSGYQSD
jgi:hypothetical protein